MGRAWSRRSTASAPRSGRPICRCACRSRTFTSSTTGASWSGGAKAAASASATRLCSPPPPKERARVAGIEAWNAPGPIVEAHAGQSIGITLEPQIFVERGEIASLFENPPIETNVFRGRLFWMDRRPLRAGGSYGLMLLPREVPVTVQEIERVFDIDDLSSKAAAEVPRHGIADVILRSRPLLALDEARSRARTG